MFFVFFHITLPSVEGIKCGWLNSGHCFYSINIHIFYSVGEATSKFINSPTSSVFVTRPYWQINLNKKKYYPSETSCKQDLEIFEAVSKILSRSLEDNSLLYILIVSDTSVPKIFARSVQRFLDLKIIEKNSSSDYLFPRS
jgi:hypothetical protein